MLQTEKFAALQFLDTMDLAHLVKVAQPSQINVSEAISTVSLLLDKTITMLS